MPPVLELGVERVEQTPLIEEEKKSDNKQGEPVQPVRIEEIKFVEFSLSDQRPMMEEEQKVIVQNNLRP